MSFPPPGLMGPPGFFPALFSINKEETPIQQQEQPVQESESKNVANRENEHEIEKEEQIYPANQTLYVNRLNEKVSVEDLKKALFDLFSPFGEIVDIIVRKNLKMKGQAFVIMDTVEQANDAREDLHNSILYEQQIVHKRPKPKYIIFFQKVNFSKETSDIISKRDGTYQERERQPLSEKIQEHKRKIEERRRQELLNKKQSTQAPTISMPLSNDYVPLKDRSRANQPNKVLFVEGLHQVDFMNLELFFRNFIGFREFRGIKPKGVAFVEFEDELKATHCLNELNGFVFEGVALQISYQKK